MDRERQVELIESAEERTVGYVRKWIKNPAVKDALHRRNPKGSKAEPAKKRA